MTALLRRDPLALVLIVALCAAALGAACSERRAARFPHLTHLTGLACGKPGTPACLDCNSCHSVAEHGADPARVTAAACTACHQPDSAQVSQLSAPARPAQSEIAFNHDQHLALGKLQGQCVPCHGGVVQKGGQALPPMSQCFTCHEHEREWQQGQCTPCHDAADLARTPPQSFLRHDQGFVRHHGQFAMEDRRLCQACHTQEQCNGCHDASQELLIEQRRPEKIDSNRVHGGDFLVRHALEAQAEPTRCASCHEPQTCDSCHQQRGVSGALVSGRNPHPPGWVGSNAAASSFHGREARRDVLLCAGCHDQGPATNCIRCHKVGGFGGNPHPRGWQSTRSSAESMCRYCHE